MPNPWTTLAGAALLALALASFSASRVMTSHLHNQLLAPIEALDALPPHVGNWIAVASTEPTVSPAIYDAFGNAQQVYDKVVSRVYAGPDGTRIQVMLAYKVVQRQEDRVHSPELCYYSQGFALSNERNLMVASPAGGIEARAFLGTTAHRAETVVYWIRTGQTVGESSLSNRIAIFRDGLHGMLDDGLLVRASVVDAPGTGRGVAASEMILSGFLANLVRGSGIETRAMLAGSVGA